MTDNEKIDLMIKEIKSVILKRTGEDSKVSIIEIDGCRRIDWPPESPDNQYHLNK